MNVLSVVIPAYNEEGGIAEIIERTLSIRHKLAEAAVDDLELIVVDDGSSDRTADITAANAQVRLIRHPVNRECSGIARSSSPVCDDRIAFHQ